MVYLVSIENTKKVWHYLKENIVSHAIGNALFSIYIEKFTMIL
jgi:hypothetical protein